MEHAQKKIVLRAGEYCFDRAGVHVHTLLGSCISITLWHPMKRIGGMCHFALPRPSARPPHTRPDPRYAEDCIELFQRSIARRRTRIQEYEVKVFGGGNLYEGVACRCLDAGERQSIGDKNAAAAFNLLMATGANILVAHVGEFGHRRLVFDIATGAVWVRFTPLYGANGDVRSLAGRN